MKPWDPWVGMTVLVVIIFLIIYCTLIMFPGYVPPAN